MQKTHSNIQNLKMKSNILMNQMKIYLMINDAKNGTMKIICYKNMTNCIYIYIFYIIRVTI